MPIRIRQATYRGDGFVSRQNPQFFIGERGYVEIEAYFENVVFFTEDIVCTLAPTYAIAQTAENWNIIHITNSTFFSDVKVGDILYIDPVTFTVGGNGGSCTVLEVLSSEMVRVNKSFTFEDSNFGGVSDGYISVITPYTNIEVKFAQNTSLYIDKATGLPQKAVGYVSTGLSDMGVVLQDLLNVGNLSWQKDLLEITGLGTSFGQQKFKLTWLFIALPINLSVNFQDFQNFTAPDYYTGESNIKPIAEISIASNSDIKSDSPKVSWSGEKLAWFNQKWDRTNPRYKINSLALSDVATSASVNTLQFGKEIKVEIIYEQLDTANDAINTQVSFGFSYLPLDETNYKNINYTQERNFCYDSKLVKVSDGILNGINNGTDWQVIKTIKVENIDSTKNKLTAVIEFGSEVDAKLRQESEAWYCFWIIAENGNVYGLKNSDKSSLLVQVDKVYEQLVTIDLLDSETVFIEHPYVTSDKGKATLEMFPTDDVVANSLITLDYTGHENEGIKLISCTPSIQLTHASEADIRLDSITINLENFATVGNSPAVQDIESVSLRPFKASDDTKKEVVFGRDYLNDSGLTKAFALSFPFVNRYEYWIKLLGISSIPSSLFDSSQLYKGMNNLWNRLANASGWELTYRIRFVIEQNGQQFEQVLESPIDSVYYDSNADWINNTLKSYVSAGGSEMVKAGKKYLKSNENTYLEAIFEKVTPPSTGLYAIVFFAEKFEGLGVAELNQLSSEYDKQNTSWFAPISGNRLDKSNVGNVYKGKCYVDFTKIRDKSKVTIYARIYEIETTGSFVVRVTNDEAVRVMLDENIRLINS